MSEWSSRSKEGFKRLVASPWHTILVVGVVAGNAYLGAIHAQQARAGLGASRVSMYLRTLGVEWLLLGIVVTGVWLRGAPLETILGKRWQSRASISRDRYRGWLTYCLDSCGFAAQWTTAWAVIRWVQPEYRVFDSANFAGVGDLGRSFDQCWHL